LLISETFHIRGKRNPRDGLDEIFMERTAIQSELLCINQGLAQVIQKWTELDEYLGGLLIEDFMEPKQYAALLFDDENFTRSRKYFWAIGCLNEFDISIGDNIKQWDLYYAARLSPILEDAHAVERFDNASVRKPEYNENPMREVRTGEKEFEAFKMMVKTGTNHREALVDLKAQFKAKLEQVKALRDGVSHFKYIYTYKY